MQKQKRDFLPTLGVYGKSFFVLTYNPDSAIHSIRRFNLFPGNHGRAEATAELLILRNGNDKK